MSVAVRNESGYPTREVARIVRAVLRDVEADDVDVIVMDDPRGLHGRYSASWRPDLGQTRERIRLWLPPEGAFPRDWHYYVRTRREMPPPLTIRCWREGLVALAAHEGHHHVQTPRNGYGRKRPGSKRAAPRYREDECEWAAYRAVQRFRDER